MKKRNLVTLVLSGILAVGVLGGCGSTSTDSAASGSAASSTAPTSTSEAAASTAEASESTNSATVTLKIAASTTPHAEILEYVKPTLAKEGVNLEIKEFEDYVQSNLVVDSGEYDANYFQHITYLNNFNEEKGTDLVDAGDIHYEPFGIYPGQKKSLDEINCVL